MSDSEAWVDVACRALSHSGATRLYTIAKFMNFTGDFSNTAKGISTKLSTQKADGLECNPRGQISEICRRVRSGRPLKLNHRVRVSHLLFSFLTWFARGQHYFHEACNSHHLCRSTNSHLTDRQTSERRHLTTRVEFCNEIAKFV